MSDVLNVTLRESRGTRNARRMRQSGDIPAVLYGHKKETLSLTVSADEVEAALRHGGHVVELKGAASESALIRDVQWDTFGHDVLHLDLYRVRQDEVVEIEVTVELRGEAPGDKEGGIVEHLLHELELACPVAAIPDKLVININTLELEQSILAGEVKLPEGAILLTDPDAVVVQCTMPTPEVEVEEEAVAAAGAEEPEVIGRKEEEEEGEEEK